MSRPEAGPRRLPGGQPGAVTVGPWLANGAPQAGPPSTPAVPAAGDADDLYRLVHAEGSFRSVEGGQGQDGRYDMTMRYDSIHRITLKDQKAFNKAVGGNEQPEVKGTYLYNYVYGATQPHAPTQIGNRTFGYDANGNQTGYQTSNGGGPDRNIVWDEENRIQAIKDGGGDPLQSGLNFDYSDSGERVVKYHGGNRSLYINQFVSLKHANSNSGHVLSKHVFVGNTRVLTHLGSTPNKGGDGKDHGSSGLGNDDGLDWVRVIVPSTFIYNGAGANGKAGTAVEGDEFSLLDTNAHGTRYKINYQGKVGFIEMADVQIVTPEQTQSILPSKDWIFYYHPDHLGSVGYLTDRQGQLHETTLYFPFGETWMEQRRGVQLFPNYAFTGKELDEETGLYYFGARYYDPRMSVWQNVDPILERYLDGKPSQGVYTSKNLGLYGYGWQNPVTYSDPDGNFVIPIPFTNREIVFQQKADKGYRFDINVRGSARHINPSPGGFFAQLFGSRKISFENDIQGGPSTDLPVTQTLATVIEKSVVETGSSININSSTGGDHGGRAHPAGQAVDINRVNGQRVDNENSAADVDEFQRVAGAQEGVSRAIGPRSAAINPRVGPQRQAGDAADLMRSHNDHLHIGTNPPPER